MKRQMPEGRFFFPLSGKEKLGLLLKSIAAVCMLNYCFFREWLMFLLLLPVGIGFFRKEKGDLLRRKKEEAGWQFKEMLLLTVTGQKAGYSVENAFLMGYEDLAALFGRNSSICRMLTQLRIGLENGGYAGDLWKSIGEMTAIVEIQEFARVFIIAKESGGNMPLIMERTAGAIETRVEMEREITAFLSAGRLEQRIMNLMPFFLMLYVDLTSPGYFSGLYHSMEGRLLMSAGLLLYLGAYVLGERSVSRAYRLS